MANHKIAVEELSNHVERDYLRLGYSIGRQTNTSLEILCPPEMDDADFIFDDIKANFDSPACSISYSGRQIIMTVQFDRQGTHIIRTGMTVSDAIGVLGESLKGCIPSLSTVAKFMAVILIIFAVQYRELLARELEWRTAHLQEDE